MSKLDILTIVVVVVGIFALGILIYQIVQNNELTQNTPASAIEEQQDPYDGYDEDPGYPSNSYEDNTSDDYYDQDGAGYDETQKDGYTADDNSNDEAYSGFDDGTVQKDNYSSNSSSEGRYMVISGSFKQRANAENHAANLQKLGYSNAAMHIFDRGAYAVVLVDRFDNLNEANQLKERLKSEHSIESYVLPKKMEKI